MYGDRSVVPLPTSGERVTRTVQYVVRFQGGPNRGSLVQFAASDQTLSYSQAEQIRRDMRPPFNMPLRRDSGTGSPDRLLARNLISDFASVCGQSAGASEEALRNFLLGDDAVVPKYGSPPRDWISLQSVIPQAAGAITAIGVGGNIPTLFLAYAGGVVLVYFVNPIAQEAGRAVAEGVGARIRRAFDLPSIPAIGAENPPPEDQRRSLGSGGEP